MSKKHAMSKETTKKRSIIHQVHIEQNRKAGAHKNKSKYSRKTKHKKQNHNL